MKNTPSKAKAVKNDAATIEAAVLDKMSKMLPKLVHKEVVGVAAPTERKMGELKMPKEGGVCRAVWDGLDLLASGKKQVTVATAVEFAKSAGLNVNNARTEYYRWKAFRATHPRRSRKSTH